MRSLPRTILLLLSPLVASGQPAPQAPPPDRYVLVHAGTLLAVPGAKPQERATVVVKNDRIAAVENGYLATVAGAAPGATVEVIDLSERFVLPGLMDAHVHLYDEPNFSRRRIERGDRYPPYLNVPANGAEGAVNAVVYAQRTLAAGFTTVRDVGSDDQAVFAVRNAINAGRLPGPRILVSGPAVSVTGGHGDTQPLTRSGDAQGRLTDATCDGPAECRTAVRHLSPRGDRKADRSGLVGRSFRQLHHKPHREGRLQVGRR